MKKIIFTLSLISMAFTYTNAQMKDVSVESVNALPDGESITFPAMFQAIKPGETYKVIFDSNNQHNPNSIYVGFASPLHSKGKDVDDENANTDWTFSIELEGIKNLKATSETAKIKGKGNTNIGYVLNLSCNYPFSVSIKNRSGEVVKKVVISPDNYVISGIYYYPNVAGNGTLADSKDFCSGMFDTPEKAFASYNASISTFEKELQDKLFIKVADDARDALTVLMTDQIFDKVYISDVKGKRKNEFPELKAMNEELKSDIVNLSKNYNKENQDKMDDLLKKYSQGTRKYGNDMKKLTLIYYTNYCVGRLLQGNISESGATLDYIDKNSGTFSKTANFVLRLYKIIGMRKKLEKNIYPIVPIDRL